eukprot:scaffold100396_cov33-Tisochrysis_lutea.AAC.3
MRRARSDMVLGTRICRARLVHRRRPKVTAKGTVGSAKEGRLARTGLGVPRSSEEGRAVASRISRLELIHVTERHGR